MKKGRGVRVRHMDGEETAPLWEKISTQSPSWMSMSDIVDNIEAAEPPVGVVTVNIIGVFEVCFNALLLVSRCISLQHETNVLSPLLLCVGRARLCLVACCYTVPWFMYVTMAPFFFFLLT